MKRDVIFQIRLFETVVLTLPVSAVVSVKLEYLAKDLVNLLANG